MCSITYFTISDIYIRGVSVPGQKSENRFASAHGWTSKHENKDMSVTRLKDWDVRVRVHRPKIQNAGMSVPEQTI
jgi:hypothetical protein